MLKENFDVILCACFGTANLSEFNKTYGVICRHISVATDVPVYTRITSDFIFDALGNSDLLPMKSAFEFLKGKGYKKIKVLPVLMAGGREYSKIEELCSRYEKEFSRIFLEKPLLQRECKALAGLLCCACEERAGHKYLLLGHGSGKSAGEYDNLSRQLLEIGRGDISISLLHDSKGIELYSEYSYTFIPLMICAGHHIRDSFEALREKCEKEGIKGEFFASGLAENPDFCQLF